MSMIVLIEQAELGMEEVTELLKKADKVLRGEGAGGDL